MVRAVERDVLSLLHFKDVVEEKPTRAIPRVPLCGHLLGRLVGFRTR
jgi:hypothetical protein